MKKISLKDVKGVLSRKEMKAISGGHSWLYCTAHSLDIVVFGLTILDGEIDTRKQWDACRAA